MCRRDQRPFGSRTARAAHSWAHYAFRQRLVSSAARRAGARVVETTEAYTTRPQPPPLTKKNMEGLVSVCDPDVWAMRNVEP